MRRIEGDEPLRMLSDRRQRVLAALIEEYVAHAMPVGSQTLTDRYKLGVSSATVRNELSALECEGYISQPHTSAGRIPTDFGYRAFVDDLIARGVLEKEAAYRKTLEQMRASARELDELMERTSSELAVLTECLSVVMPSEQHHGHIYHIGLTSLMRKPEFRHSCDLIPIIQVLEDDTILFELLEPSSDAAVPTVRIGSENQTEEFSGVSIVSTRYGHGDAAGIVAVIGPTRMDYSKVLHAVSVARSVLNEE